LWERGKGGSPLRVQLRGNGEVMRRRYSGTRTRAGRRRFIDKDTKEVQATPGRVRRRAWRIG
jgi:hypothetical protein